MLNEFNIQTKRLLLRTMQPADAAAVFAYRSDAATNRYQGWIPETIGDVTEFIDHRISPDVDVPGTWYQLVIIRKDEGQLIGDVGIHFSDADNEEVELGCTLDKKEHGKGYATEAFTAVIDYLFDNLNKQRITASVDPRNVKSIQLIERLGFQKQLYTPKAFLLNGEWVDDVVYCLEK